MNPQFAAKPPGRRRPAQEWRPSLFQAKHPAVLPFVDAQEAWFWTMAALKARHHSSLGCAPTLAVARPATPEDILRCLDRLYRQRRIDLLHARILKIWGERGIAPEPSREWQRCDANIWREAIGRLEWPLRVKGIVAARAPETRPTVPLASCPRNSWRISGLGRPLTR